jgi:hypothetical protein
MDSAMKHAAMIGSQVSELTMIVRSSTPRIDQMLMPRPGVR